MTDLASFLLSCIAEDEANIDGDWAGGDGGLHIISEPMRCRMRAECEAKRRIVELHEGVYHSPAGADSSWDDFTQCKTCRGDYPDDWPCPTLRALASVYADHPTYRDEWAD